MISHIFHLLSELNFDEFLVVATHTAGAPNELVTALGAAAHELPLPPPWREAGQSEPLTLSQSLVYEYASDTSVHFLRDILGQNILSSKLRKSTATHER